MGVLQTKSERLSNSLLEFEQIEIELEFTYISTDEKRMSVSTNRGLSSSGLLN